MDNKKRCKWCNLKNPLYIEYHDNEWCIPKFDDKYLFELLLLESFHKQDFLGNASLIKGKVLEKRMIILI